ncbi:hypothetical protein Pmar_PMAR005252, partial [Perkinsus marinus ATCC 50983]
PRSERYSRVQGSDPKTRRDQSAWVWTLQLDASKMSTIGSAPFVRRISLKAKT